MCSNYVPYDFLSIKNTFNLASVMPFKPDCLKAFLGRSIQNHSHGKWLKMRYEEWYQSYNPCLNYLPRLLVGIYILLLLKVAKECRSGEGIICQFAILLIYCYIISHFATDAVSIGILIYFKISFNNILQWHLDIRLMNRQFRCKFTVNQCAKQRK